MTSWCLEGRIILSVVFPQNIMSRLENGDQRTVSLSSHLPLCCVLAPMPAHLVKFNSSQTEVRAMFPNPACLSSVMNNSKLLL